MPQYLTLSINAKVEKGSEIKSEAKFEVNNAFALVDETICKCSTNNPPFEVPEFKTPLQLMITADKYASEKDCMPSPNGTRICEPKKYISFRLLKSGTQARDYINLQRPQIMEIATGFDAIQFKNDLTIDVKVSVLIFRPTVDPPCPSPTPVPIKRPRNGQLGYSADQEPELQEQSN